MTISTLHIMRASYLSIAENQKRLADAQEELSTGRIANPGPALGINTSKSIDLRLAFDRNSVEKDLNGFAAAELKTKQDGLSSLIDLAHSFAATLIGSRNAQNGGETIKVAARNALAGLQEIMNTTHGGKAIFSGINDASPPLADYLSTTPPASRVAVNTAFQVEFGMNQSAASVSSITPAQMDTFLNGNFAAQFNAANWQANWSSADSQNRSIRISDIFQVQSVGNANDAAFSNLTMAITMALDLGSGSLAQATLEKVVDKATSIASTAANQLGEISGNLGITQNLLTDQTTKISQRQDIINRQLSQLEGVDQFELSTRINTLTTQLEASYSLTARINKLSLLNYL